MTRSLRERSVYEQQRQVQCAPYAANFEGDTNALFCVVSQEQATKLERSALLASAERGGFSAHDVIWITTNDLAAPALFQLIETVDPLCLVVLDERAAEQLSRAYNQPIKLEVCDLLLGRPCCCFIHFERMLQTDDQKQRAWALLKELLERISLR